MFALQCLQASSSPLQLLTGKFSGPSLLLVKEWSLELYQWDVDVAERTFELTKLYEELTFFKVLSAAKVELPVADAVLVTIRQVGTSGSLLLYKYTASGFQVVSRVLINETLGSCVRVSHTASALLRLIGTSSDTDTLWLGNVMADGLTEFVTPMQGATDLNGFIWDWTFVGTEAVVLRYSQGSTYPDVVTVDGVSLELRLTIALGVLVSNMRDLPINIVSCSDDSFFLFLSNGEMLQFEATFGTLRDLTPTEKLYSSSCPAPSGLFLSSDDGCIFFLNPSGRIRLLYSSQPNSILAYQDNLLFTWSLTGCGKVFLLSDDYSAINEFPLPGHGPVIDAFPCSESSLIALCGTDPLTTIRKAEKGEW